MSECGKFYLITVLSPTTHFHSVLIPQVWSIQSVQCRQ